MAPSSLGEGLSIFSLALALDFARAAAGLRAEPRRTAKGSRALSERESGIPIGVVRIGVSFSSVKL